jgi:cation diffusion facilitator CzcD-associated flavoprotein CzcO
MNTVFADQGTNEATNDIVSEFVRNKIRSIVRDPVVAEALCPKDHPIGTRRLCLDTDYYATYNRPNVRLVNLRVDPLETLTETGIRTRSAHHELDLIVFALGFHAFTGQIDGVEIRNERGASPTDHWKHGPRTCLGVMTNGFPNFFFLTGPGSPSVLANMTLGNEFHVDWVADCIRWMGERGHTTVEPTEAGVDAWQQHVAEVASPLLRLQVNNYMVHVNRDDGTRVFMPYTGGMGRFVERVRGIVARGYEGFRFGGTAGSA